MANNPVAPVGLEPTNFAELFQSMPDVYNGQYQAFLAAYAVNGALTSKSILRRTIARFPVSQVPAVFAYLAADGFIRTVHHFQYVEAPIGQNNPWEQIILGFSGDVHMNQVTYASIPIAEFFDNTEAVQVPTVATFGAVLTALAADETQLGPYVDGTPNTEEIRSRRAVPVPHAYVHLLFNRVLTPREAWEQVGAQIILDQREESCSILLDFLQTAGTYRRNRARRPQPPSVLQPTALTQPLGDQAL
jgi:hypothetical protein